MEGLIPLVSVVLAVSVFLVTLINTDAAIILLLFSMLLSPEINLVQLQDRAVIVRFDDLLLGVVFFTWLAKLAINKQLGLLRSTPLNVPLGMFLLSCVVSTIWGVLNGTMDNPTASFFFLLKYFEYFFLFFMVANVIHERRQVEMFLRAIFATAICVSLYAYWQIIIYGAGSRVTAPFEGPHGEPNTLAGYLLLILAVCAGRALYAPSPLKRFLSIGLIALMIPPFMYTYSRGGYLAFVATYLTLCVVSRRYRPLLWSVLVLGIFAAPLIVPASVIERVAGTFTSVGAVRVGRLYLEPSAGHRILVWRLIIDKWREHPFLGFGVTGIGFVDSQHALVIGELGLVGLLIYLWVRWRILTMSYRAYKTIDDPWGKGLSLGFLAGFVGLLFQSFAGNIFIIVRIMEPFWFLAAMVMVLPQVVSHPQQSPTAHSSLPKSLIPAGHA